MSQHVENLIIKCDVESEVNTVISTVCRCKLETNILCNDFLDLKSVTQSVNSSKKKIK